MLSPLFVEQPHHFFHLAGVGRLERNLTLLLMHVYYINFLKISILNEKHPPLKI